VCVCVCVFSFLVAVKTPESLKSLPNEEIIVSNMINSLIILLSTCQSTIVHPITDKMEAMKRRALSLQLLGSNHPLNPSLGLNHQHTAIEHYISALGMFILFLF
jgi:hypothetical protein